MSKHVHPAPRTTLRIALLTLAEILMGLPVRDGRRVAE